MYKPKKGGAYSNIIPELNNLSTTGVILPNVKDYLNMIGTNNNTLQEYKNIVTFLSQQSSVVYSNLINANTVLNSETNIYNNAISTYASLSSIFLSSIHEIRSSYFGYSTVEGVSTMYYLDKYGIYTTNGNAMDAMINFSTTALSSLVESTEIEIHYYSSFISTYKQICLNDSNQMSSLLSSLYFPQLSTISTLQSQLSIAIHRDKINEIEVNNATSTYNYYYNLSTKMAFDYAGYILGYASTNTAIGIQSVICSTAHELRDFQVLQSSLMGSQFMFNSTSIMLQELKNIVNLQSQGIDISQYFNNVKYGIQRGGDEISNLLNTVNSLYSQYSTVVVNLTNQMNTRYGTKTPEEATSYIAETNFKTLMEQYNNSINSYQKLYEGALPSTKIIADILSSQRAYYSSIVRTTISDDEIQKVYTSAVQDYETTLTEKYRRVYELNQNLYIFEASSIKLENKELVEADKAKAAIDRIYRLGGKVDRQRYEEYKRNNLYSGISNRIRRSILREVLDATFSSVQNTGGGGILADLQAQSTTQTSLITTITSELEEISSTSLTLGSKTLSQIKADLGTEAGQYYQAIGQANVYMSTQMSFEMLSYLNALYSLSTSFTMNLLKNTIRIQELSYTNMGVAVNLNQSGLNTIQGLKNNSSKIRTVIKSNEVLIKMLLAENFVKQYYMKIKSEYEKQSYYRVISASPSIYRDLMPQNKLDNLTTYYDLTIQGLNRYIGNRQAYYAQFVNTIAYAVANYLDPELSEDIRDTHEVLYTDPVTNISTTFFLSSVYPLTMRFNTMPFRNTIFVQRQLPPENLITCPVTSLASKSAIQNVTPYDVSTLSYTPDTTVYGIRGQFVRIQRPDNNVEILQIIVIDSTGKNAALRCTVTAPTITNRTGNLENIVNGNYDTTTSQSFSFISGPGVSNPNVIKTIWINLGTVCDITAVQYLKSEKSSYNSAGFRVQIYAADQVTAVSPVMSLSANTPSEWLDFRITETKANGDTVPMFLLNTRRGICGTLARYVRIQPSTIRKLQISQIAVISSDGNNRALGLIANLVVGSTKTPIPNLTDGTYASRIYQLCYTNLAVPAGAYIEIDFSREIDVTAVHVYNTNTKPSYQLGTIVDLYTADNQLAFEKILITDNMKEVLDFRYYGSNAECPIEMNWSSYYGSAGVIGRYIGIEKAQGVFGFSKIEIIDKSGRDVGLYNRTFVTSSKVSNTSYLGVTNYTGPQPAAISYQSASGTNQKFVVDLREQYEICAMNIYACSDAPNLLDGTTLEIYDSNPFVNSSYRSFFTRPIILNGLSCFFDTRRDPEISPWPTTVSQITTTYGLFGTLANNISIPGNPASVRVTDGTGRSVEGVKSYDGTNTKIILGSSSVLYDITSVIITGPNPPLGTFISVIGCENLITGYQPLFLYTDPTTNASFILADFRNPSKSPYAPLVPLPAVRFNTMPTTSVQYSELSTMYGTIIPDTGLNNSPPKGILARYVKVIPRDATTPMYISQIVVVDSNGINVAFEKDTFTPNMALLERGEFAVDGIFALSLDDPNYSIIALADYVSKPESRSFVSQAGNPGTNYFTIDLGMEYFVNSVIYVSAKGTVKQRCTTDTICPPPPNLFSFGENVIIELYNANVQRVAVKPVSKYVTLFGVDVLDFRQDFTARMTDPGCWLEVRPRVVQLGPGGCGMMGQYIRIFSAVPGTRFVVSQLIVTDSYGNNVALYKPTYSSTNPKDAYRIVDGSYYQKLTQYAYASKPDAGAPVDFIEVNFGNELEVVNIFLINAQDAAGYSQMKIQVYNGNRDTIAELNMTGPDYSNIIVNATTFIFPINNRNTLPVYNTTTNNITMPVIGVNVMGKLSDFTIANGLVPPSIMPPVNTPPTQIISKFTREISCTPTPASLSNLFTRGPNGGIPVRFVRVYNVGRYIQVSQIMVYGGDGTNYAYHAPCRAQSVYPGTYVATVTDGEGGYFHAARPCSECFKSNGGRYDFLEVDCGDTYEVVGVRCVFASDNQGQNVGAQIQILTDNDGSAGAILGQHVITSSEYADILIDFRLPPISKSISKLIMPKIFTTVNLPPALSNGGPNGIVEGNDGTVYIVDTIQHCIWSTATTVPYFGSVGIPKNNTQGLNFPVGIVRDENYFYVSDYGNNRIVRISIISRVATVFVPSIANPYGLFYANNVLYCTCNNRSGTIYSYNTIGTISQTAITPSTVILLPNSILAIGAHYYISSARTGIVYRVSISSPNSVTPFIGSTGCTITVPLLSVSALAYDISENVFFISDYVQDKIFALANFTTANPILYNLAGTGNGGYSGDGSQAINATMDGPMYLLYSPSKGFLYISDYKNSTIRYLQIYSSTPMPFSTTTAVPRWGGWTTTTLASITDNMTAPTNISTEPIQTPAEFKILTRPTAISNIISTGVNAFYISGQTLYYVNSSNSLYSASTTGTFSPVAITPSGSITFGTITSLTVYSNNLYLCDTTNNCVYKMDLTSKTITKYIGASGATITASLLRPTWIGFDLYGTLYISDTGNFCIRRLSGLSQLETYVGILGTQGSNQAIISPMYGIQASLHTPLAFVFDSNNNLIFVDSGSNAVYKVAGENRMGPISPRITATKPFIDTFYAESSFPSDTGNTQVRVPYGITIDSSDTLYITAKSGQQVVKFSYNTLTGVYVPSIVAGFGSDTIGRTSSTDTNAYTASLNNPTGIQCLPGSEIIYFIDNTNTFLRMITPARNTVYPLNEVIPYGPIITIANDTKNTYNTTAPSGGDENLGVLENFQANYVCTSLAGTLYFPNKLLNTILKLDSSGNLAVVASGFSQPEGIAIYNDSMLYVADSANNSIHSIVISSGATTPIISGVTTPYSLAVNKIGYLFYSYMNSTTPTVGIYNLRTGTQSSVSIIPTVMASQDTGAVRSIDSITIDTDGNLYVAVTASIGIGAYVERSYYIYMYRISYNSTGLTVGTQSVVPSSGGANNKQAGPYKGLTFLNGTLLFSSTGKNSVFSIETLPSIGTTPFCVVGQNNLRGQTVDGSYSHTTSLNKPLGICVDANNVLYILDEKASGSMVLLKNTNNNILQQSLTYTISGSNTQGLASGYVSNKPAYFQSFNTIGGVCYDSLGQVYICDTGMHCISMINLDGIIKTFVGTVGVSGYSGDGDDARTAKLNGPTDIKMSRSNVLYIADTGNNCIRRVKIFGDYYQINTFGPIFNPGPISIAIDSNENVFVSNKSQKIYVITPTEQVLPYFTEQYVSGTQIFDIGVIAVDINNTLYFTGKFSMGPYLYTDNICYVFNSSENTYLVSLPGFKNITSMLFDISNNLYISDSTKSVIYKYSGGNLITVVGNGLSEYIFNAVEVTQIPQNIYGNGIASLQRFLYSPVSLSLDPVKGLLVAQTTKVVIYNLTGSSPTSSCGTITTTITINNVGSSSLYLSQVVALNNSGMNVLLKTTSNSYVDGFYGCKPTNSAFILSGNSNITMNINDDIVFIMLYLGANGGSYTKANWNGATVVLNGNNTRTIKGIPANDGTDIPLQYVLFDYRKKTPLCMPVYNYMNKYVSQDTATMFSISNRQIYLRYITMVIDNSTVVSGAPIPKFSISQIAVIHAQTGADLAKTANFSSSSGTNVNSYKYGTYIKKTQPVSQSDTWVNIDLMDEYPIEKVILYCNNLSVSYIVTAYTATRIPYSPFVVPTATTEVTSFSFTPSSGIKNVRYIKYVGNNNYPLQISQLIILDVNGVNVGYRKSVTTSSGNGASVVNTGSIVPSSTPYISSNNNDYLQVDLGQEYEIMQIVYVNINGTEINQYKSRASTIRLLNSAQELIVYYNVLGSSAIGQVPSNPGYTPGSNSTVETFSFRSSGNLSLAYSLSASIDPALTKLLRAQYIQFGDPSADYLPSITNISVYDIYGKNISVAKRVRENPLWNIDLGETYTIRDITVTIATNTSASTVPYSILDKNNNTIFSGTANQGTNIRLSPVLP